MVEEGFGNSSLLLLWLFVVEQLSSYVYAEEMLFKTLIILPSGGTYFLEL